MSNFTRLVVASPLDVAGSPNSRTLHVVRGLAPSFRETIAISRANVTYRGRRERWSALVRIRTEARQDGSIRWVALTPLGSVRHGLGLHLLRLPNPYARPRGVARRVLRRLFSVMGAALELGTLPSLLVTYLTHAGGRVDVFVGQGPWEVALGLCLRASGRATVVIYDDIDYAPGFQSVSAVRRRWTAAIERAAIRRADVVTSVGDRLAALRQAQGARDVRVVPNGVDVAHFATAHRDRGAAGPRPPTLIYVGYLGAWAGVDLLLEAAARIVSRLLDLRVIVLGHGTPLDLEALQSGIRDRRLARVVDFRGEVPHAKLPTHLAEADVGVALFRPLDLTRYAFPLKVVEYMAAGLPVLTTADTEAADLVTRFGAGTTVAFDAAAVAAAAEALLVDPRRRKAHGDAGLRAARGFDWADLIAKQLAAIVDVSRRCAPTAVRGTATTEAVR